MHSDGGGNVYAPHCLYHSFARAVMASIFQGASLFFPVPVLATALTALSFLSLEIPHVLVFALNYVLQ